MKPSKLISQLDFIVRNLNEVACGGERRPSVRQFTNGGRSHARTEGPRQSTAGRGEVTRLEQAP